LASLETEIFQEEGDLIEETRDVGFEENIIKAKNLCETHERIEADLLKEMTTLEGEVEKESQLMRKGNEIEQEYARMKSLYTMIDQRIYALSVESQAPGRISLESIARSIKQDNLKKLMTMAAVLAAGLSFGCCVLLERRDNVIRLREDVESAMGAPPSWPIEDYRVNGKERVLFSRVTLDDSGCNSAKAIRSLAVKLNQERQSFGAKIIVFTGCNGRSGVSTLVLNTAHSLRQMMEKVLVIDMNMDHANLAFLTNHFELDKGVIEAVRDPAQLDACIKRDEERGIDLLLMKSGISYRDLDRGKFVSLLHRLQERYEVILIDSAPIMKSDLTEYLVVNSQVVVPIVQGNCSLYHEVHHMTKILLRLEVKTIAPVLNWNQVERSAISNVMSKKRKWRFPLPRFLRRNMIRRKVRAREEARRAAGNQPMM